MDQQKSKTSKSNMTIEELQSDELQGVPDWPQSSNMDWMMKVFQNIEMLPVLLVNYLLSREQKWYRGNTTSLLISRKTGIAISV